MTVADLHEDDYRIIRETESTAEEFIAVGNELELFTNEIIEHGTVNGKMPETQLDIILALDKVGTSPKLKLWNVYKVFTYPPVRAALIRIAQRDMAKQFWSDSAAD